MFNFFILLLLLQSAFVSFQVQRICCCCFGFWLRTNGSFAICCFWLNAHCKELFGVLKIEIQYYLWYSQKRAGSTPKKRDEEVTKSVCAKAKDNLIYNLSDFIVNDSSFLLTSINPMTDIKCVQNVIPCKRPKSECEWDGKYMALHFAEVYSEFVWFLMGCKYAWRLVFGYFIFVSYFRLFVFRLSAEMDARYVFAWISTCLIPLFIRGCALILVAWKHFVWRIVIFFFSFILFCCLMNFGCTKTMAKHTQGTKRWIKFPRNRKEWTRNYINLNGTQFFVINFDSLLLE